MYIYIYIGYKKEKRKASDYTCMRRCFEQKTRKKKKKKRMDRSEQEQK
jgi:hypothetical protein